MNIKRWTAMILTLLLCLNCAQTAFGTEPQDYCDDGLLRLKLLNPEDVAESIAYFQNAGSYGFAPQLKNYAQAVLDLLDPQSTGASEMTGIRLDQLAGRDDFTRYLADQGLPSCADLILYAKARQLETKGDYTGAIVIYEQIDILDAFDRIISLRYQSSEERYQAALALLEKGDVNAALRALKDMHWKESDEKYQEALEKHTHEWQPATCTEPERCAICGETNGIAPGHEWQPATCTEPERCARCGEIRGAALGHDWQDGSCTEPETCARCGKTVGSAPGHDWQPATCTEPETCARCGEIKGAALGHSWLEATYDRPKTCSRCGLTEGEPLKKKVAKGSIVTFGHYEQDNNTSNGKEDIEWIVLKVQGNKALLISKYGLDTKPYNKDYTSVTWETCTLRKWLNNEFMKEAFSADEQGAILLTQVDNSNAQGYSGYGTNGGNNTQDKVFLLSVHEAFDLYFTSDSTSAVRATAYAKAQGAYVNSVNRNSYWWLRSPGLYQSSAYGMDPNGSLVSSSVNYKCGVVRPALWIDLGSVIY